MGESLSSNDGDGILNYKELEGSNSISRVITNRKLVIDGVLNCSKFKYLEMKAKVTNL